jgi:hypothetical protein
MSSLGYFGPLTLHMSLEIFRKNEVHEIRIYAGSETQSTLRPFIFDVHLLKVKHIVDITEYKITDYYFLCFVKCSPYENVLQMKR